MKTIIYYFTGTGNSLAAARKVAAATGDCELIPIAVLQETRGAIVPQADRVGIVCPVYFFGLPVMVAEWAARLDPAAASYVFAIITHGGGGESAALRQLDAILRQRQGRGLDAGFGVVMPGNYILKYESPQGKEREAILAKADKQIAMIAGNVVRCEKRTLPASFVSRLLYNLVYPWFRSHVRTEDKKFTVSDKCTSCGTCVAVCPSNNIELAEGKPVWKHRCELCCSCIHNCPVQAIQAGIRTEMLQRYRNPDVTLADLKIRTEDMS